MSFMIFPAIDLKGGKCVRLKQGLADQQTIYSDDPVAMALQWQAQGGEYLHLVDLDGAFEGRPVHTEVISKIVDALDIPVELGGGLRSEEHVEAVLETGIRRAILGTRALQSPELIERLVGRFGDRLAVGIDARDSRVQVSGWVDTTDVDAFEFAKQVCDLGVQTIIFTDTSRDGMMSGVAADSMAKMCDTVSCDVVASGGVTTLEDITTLKALSRANLQGAIVGKALYDERVTMADLNEVAKS